MRRRTAERLVAGAVRTRADGTHGLLSQVALAWLEHAGGRGDRATTDALWDRWLDDPDDAVWSLLARWRRPAWRMPNRALSCVALGGDPVGAGQTTASVFRVALIGAARTRRHPVGETTRARILADRDPDVVDAVCAVALDREVLAGGAATLTGFCVANHLTPTDPVRRAVFLLLTGQRDQHAAADSDGSLLALGYSSASDAEREALRRRMVGAGDIPVLRVVTGGDRRGRLTRMTTEEVAYLTAQLADRQDWAELWRLARDVAPVAAVGAVSRFPGGWRPDGDRDRELFELLLGAGADEVLAARDALAAPFRVPVPGPVRAAAFAQDGRRLAVRTAAGEDARPRVLVYDLAGGTLLEEHRVPGDHQDPDPGGFHPGRMLYNGDTLVVAVGSDLLMVTGGRVDRRPQDAPVKWLAQRRRGIAALQAGRLVFLSGAGKELGRTPSAPDGKAALAAELVTRRLAVAGGSMVILDVRRASRAGVVTYRSMGTPARAVCFAGPDRVVTVHSRGVELWDLMAPLAVKTQALTTTVFFGSTTGATLTAAGRNPLAGARDPVFLPHRDETALLDADGRVRYLDAATLTEVEGARELTGRRGTGLVSAPKGRYHALAGGSEERDGGDGWVDVVVGASAAPVIALADRSLATATLPDVRTIAGARRDPVVRAVAGPLLDLLWACLRHRFATEVSLGEIERIAAEEYDVALSEDEEEDGGADGEEAGWAS